MKIALFIGPVIAFAGAAAGCTLPVQTPGTGGSTGSSTSASATSGTAMTSSSTGGAAGVGAPFFGEGTRLKANYTDFGGGAVQFTDWFDTMLGTHCNFQRTTSGFACIPNNSADATYYFSDAQCTKPLVWYSGTCNPPAYGIVQDGNADCTTPNINGQATAVGLLSVRPVGAAYSGTIYGKNGVGGCTTSPPIPGAQYSSTLAPLPIAQTFVTATTTQQARGPILKEEILQGSDGSWQLHNTYTGPTPCNLRSVNNTEQCLPVFRAFLGVHYFSDSTCTMPFTQSFGLVNTALCSPPIYGDVRDIDDKGCVLSEKLYDVGQSTTLPTLYYSASGMCYPFMLGNGSAVSLGAAIADPAAKFGAVSQETAGTGRLHAHFWGTAPTEALSNPTEIIDTTANLPCNPIAFSDKVTRCVTTDVVTNQGNSFSDSACTTHVFLYNPPNCASSTPPPTRALNIVTPPGCSASVATGLFNLSPYSGPIYQQQNAMCIPYTLQPGQQALALGAVPQDVSAFATVQVVQH